MEFVEIKPEPIIGASGETTPAYRIVYREPGKTPGRMRRRKIVAVQKDKETLGDVLRGFAAYLDAAEK